MRLPAVLGLLAVAAAIALALLRWSDSDAGIEIDDSAFPTAIALSPDGAWLALGFAADPSRIVTWRNARTRAALSLPPPYQSGALVIGDDGRVIAGLSQLATKTPFIQILRANSDGDLLQSCHSDLADPYTNRPNQPRGIQAIAVQRDVAAIATVEAGAFLVNLLTCDMTTLAPSVDDSERPAILRANTETIELHIDGVPPRAWWWSGARKTVEISPCHPPRHAAEQVPGARQWAHSSDCRVWAAYTADALFRCEGTTCTALWNRPS